MNDELIKTISLYRSQLNALAETLVAEFTSSLNSIPFNTDDSEIDTYKVVKAYHNITYKFRAEVDKAIKKLSVGYVEDDMYFTLLAKNFYNILNERRSEFQQLLKGHKDYAYISQII